MKKPLFILIINTLLMVHAIGQIGIGQWRDHLPYRKGTAVTFSGEKVWCATQGGIIEYDKGDNSIKRIGKHNGFSDVSPSDIKFNSYNSTLVVTYTSGNIDILDGTIVTNISDIKRANIVGSKTINSVFLKNDYAYLSTGFGIVVLDTRRKEIKDTYYLGVNGGYINIHDVGMDGTYIYAATDSGVYRAPLSSNNLSNFAAWSKMTGLPTGIYSSVCAFNGNVYVNFAKRLMTLAYGQDTVFVYNGSAWSPAFIPVSGYNCFHIEANANNIVFSFDGYFDVYDPAMTLVSHVYTYQNVFPAPRQVAMENANRVWVADANIGLVNVWNTWNTSAHTPDGPSTNKVYALDVKGQNVWVVPGEHNGLWDNADDPNVDGIFYYSNQSWNTIDLNTQTILDSVRDIVSVTIDPQDPTHVYAGTLGKGLIEIRNGVITTFHNQYNSALQPRGDAPQTGWVASYGQVFDEDGNLWVSNAKANTPICLRKPDGSWYAFNFGAGYQALLISNLIIDKEGQIWGVLPRGGGLLVYDPGSDPVSSADDQVKKVITGEGLGNLPSNEVYSIACDDDGEIWIGTDRGIAVIYSPENVFNGGDFDAQQIFVTQDGHTQILLETEVVTSITTDGANRKWIGTQNAGVFLLSEDGQTQIYHFEENNSPLLSSTITSIAIDGISGEVFFGTAQGLCSFRSTATDGLENFENVYAFPNPVRPGYNGIVAIRGLVKDCHVKISDISGTVVYQTRALGGQAIWDCRTFSGNKVSSGVYMVFLTNDDGSKTFVTKILVIN
ncbi:MAG: T9SS type A sorting domain-containing protein [Bacteroidia bacterium]|nr:T9SS type A sorting domain-containing protein [Bacteroidia bacterium]